MFVDVVEQTVEIPLKHPHVDTVTSVTNGHKTLR